MNRKVFSSDEVADIVFKIVGEIEPIGETNTDNARFSNLQILLNTLDILIDEVTFVLSCENRHEYSMQRAWYEVRHWIKDKRQQFTYNLEEGERMNDLISRQDAVNAIESAKTAQTPDGEIYVAKLNAEMNIQILPSAQPKKMRGRWQEITESDCSGYDPVLAGYDDPVVGYVCSACHEEYEKEVMGDVAWNYCPNCGARMEGEQDE